MMADQSPGWCRNHTLYWRTGGRDEHVPDKHVPNRLPKVGSEVAVCGMNASAIKRKGVDE